MLGVDVTVEDPNKDNDDTKGDLYKATRVAILNEDRSAANGGVFLGAETDVDTGYYKKKQLGLIQEQAKMIIMAL